MVSDQLENNKPAPRLVAGDQQSNALYQVNWMQRDGCSGERTRLASWLRRLAAMNFAAQRRLRAGTNN
jgi:hypothetical protein